MRRLFGWFARLFGIGAKPARSGDPGRNYLPGERARTKELAVTPQERAWERAHIRTPQAPADPVRRTTGSREFERLLKK